MQGNPPPLQQLVKSNPRQSKDSNNLKKADIAHLPVSHKAAEIAIPCLESVVAEEKRLCSHGPSSDRMT